MWRYRDNKSGPGKGDAGEGGLEENCERHGFDCGWAIIMLMKFLLSQNPRTGIPVLDIDFMTASITLVNVVFFKITEGLKIP